MRDEAIKVAENAAREFLRRAKAERDAREEYETPNGGHKFVTVSSKAAGALRRSSMELTRALAEMRKP